MKLRNTELLIADEVFSSPVVMDMFRIVIVEAPYVFHLQKLKEVRK